MSHQARRWFPYQIETAIYFLLSEKYAEVDLEKKHLDSEFFDSEHPIAIGESKISSKNWTVNRLFRESGKKPGPLIQLWNKLENHKRAIIFAHSQFSDGQKRKGVTSHGNKLSIPSEMLKEAMDRSVHLVKKRKSAFNIMGVQDFITDVLEFHQIPEWNVRRKIDDWCRESSEIEGPIDMKGALDLFQKPSTYGRFTRESVLNALKGRTRPESIMEHHGTRIAEILDGDTIEKMDNLPKVVIHIAPLEFHDLREKIDSIKKNEILNMFDPPGSGTPEFRRNKEGINVKQKPGGRVQSYVQLYEDGRVEIVYSKGMKNNLIEFRTVISDIREGLFRIVRFIREIGLTNPLHLCFSLVGCQDYTFASDRNSRLPATPVPEYRFAENFVTYPEVLTIDKTTNSVIQFLMPAIRYLWKLANFEDAFFKWEEFDSRSWAGLSRDSYFW